MMYLQGAFRNAELIMDGDGPDAEEEIPLPCISVSDMVELMRDEGCDLTKQESTLMSLALMSISGGLLSGKSSNYFEDTEEVLPFSYITSEKCRGRG